MRLESGGGTGDPRRKKEIGNPTGMERRRPQPLPPADPRPIIGSPSSKEGPQRAEKREKKEFIEITPDHLITMLRTDKFQHALAVAANETQSSGYETSLNVGILKSGGLHIEGVWKGGTDSTQSSVELEEIDGTQPGEQHSNLFLFHFHPFESGMIVPSSKDLATQALAGEQRKGLYFGYPYAGVGHVSQKGHVSLLIIQSPTDPITDDVIAEYESRMDEYRSQSELQEFLRNLGYENCTITLNKRGEKYLISQATQDTLKDTFAPVRVATTRWEDEEYLFPPTE